MGAAMHSCRPLTPLTLSSSLLTTPAPLTLGYGEHLHQYKRNVRAAVMSAREKAPSLLPQVWRA